MFGDWRWQHSVKWSLRGPVDISLHWRTLFIQKAKRSKDVSRSHRQYCFYRGREKSGLEGDTKASSQTCVRKQNSWGRLSLQVLSAILRLDCLPFYLPRTMRKTFIFMLWQILSFKVHSMYATYFIILWVEPTTMVLQAPCSTSWA